MLAASSPDPRRFHATQEAVEVAGLELSRWSVSAISGVAPPDEHRGRRVRIDLLTHGTVRYRVDELSGAAGQGCGVLVPCWRPVGFALAGPVQFIRITLGAELLPEALTDSVAGAFGTIGASRLIDGLLALSEQTLLDADQPTSPAASVLKQLSLAIVSEAAASSLDLRNRIAMYINAHLADPDLSPSTIADEFGISVRWAHQVFDRGGDTIGRRIRLRRCAEVARELENEPGPPSSAVLASRFGFRDPDQLARVFRSVYGVGLRDYREGHRG